MRGGERLGGRTQKGELRRGEEEISIGELTKSSVHICGVCCTCRSQKEPHNGAQCVYMCSTVRMYNLGLLGFRSHGNG